MLQNGFSETVASEPRRKEERSNLDDACIRPVHQANNISSNADIHETPKQAMDDLLPKTPLPHHSFGIPELRVQTHYRDFSTLRDGRVTLKRGYELQRRVPEPLHFLNRVPCRRNPRFSNVVSDPTVRRNPRTAIFRNNIRAEQPAVLPPLAVAESISIDCACIRAPMLPFSNNLILPLGFPHRASFLLSTALLVSSTSTGFHKRLGQNRKRTFEPPHHRMYSLLLRMFDCW